MNGDGRTSRRCLALTRCERDRSPLVRRGRGVVTYHDELVYHHDDNDTAVAVVVPYTTEQQRATGHRRPWCSATTECRVGRRRESVGPRACSATDADDRRRSVAVGASDTPSPPPAPDPLISARRAITPLAALAVGRRPCPGAHGVAPKRNYGRWLLPVESTNIRGRVFSGRLEGCQETLYTLFENVMRKFFSRKISIELETRVVTTRKS